MDIADEEGADIPRTLQQLCRLCLGDESLEDIFAQDDLHEWISDFLSIMVCMDDKITKSICFCCRTRLTEFRNFQLQCVEVQDVLQGEMTAILNEKALELIATEPENDAPQLGTEDLTVDWEQVPAAATANHAELLPPESELPENQPEWEASAGDSVVQEESEWGADTSSIAVPSVPEAWTDAEDVASNPPVGSAAPANVLNTRASNVPPGPKIAIQILQKPIKYQCDMCDKVWQTKKQLSNHRSNHTKRYPCSLCNKAFHRPVRLKQHMETHRKRNELPAETEAADAPIEIVDSPDVNDSEYEVLEIDEDIVTEPIAADLETAIVPNVIVAAIKVEELMIEDVEMDHEPVLEVDDQSGAETAENSTEDTESAPVKKKEPKTTSNPKGVECNLCGKKFQNKKQYHGHKWFVHSPKSHICSVCGKGYISPGRLAVHQRCHRRQQNRRSRFVLPVSTATEPKEVIVLPETDSFAEAEDNEEDKFECNICHKRYATARRLQTHKRITHTSKQYTCPICGRVFHIRESMIKHMLIHKETLLTIYQRPEREEVFDEPVHGPRVHVCNICKASFVQMRDMETHRATHTKEEEVKYSLERERCKSKMVTVTQGSKSFEMFQCMQCHKLVHTRRQLFDHRKRVHKPRKYTCPICGKPFVTRQDLYMHIKSHDNTARYKNETLRNEDGQFACDICHRVLGSKFTLASHIKMVHGTRRYICSYDHCKKKFTTSYDMRKHYMIHSNNRKMHQCHICAGRFITKTKLVEHLQWHERKVKMREALADSQAQEVHEVQDDTNDATVVVTVIDVDANNIDKLPSSEDKVEDFLQTNSEWMKEASSRKTAVMEVRYGTVQDAEGRLKRGCVTIPTQNCPVCEQPIQVSLMEGHLNRHAGVRPYKCEKGCEDAYYYCRLLLKNHYTRIHGNMPSQCNICHKVYPSRLRMRSHQREVHEKIHVCMNCPQIFDSLESLKKHIETANHTKRYACTKCSSSFDRQHQFNKHMRMHGEDVGESSSSMDVQDSIEVEEVKIESRVEDEGRKSTRSRKR